MADVLCVPPDHVCLIWLKVKHWIKAAMERGDLGMFADVERDVLSGQALLWVAWSGHVESAAVTQIALSEKSKVCTIVACGGLGIARWIDGIKRIEEYAKAEGCDVVRILGRKGWLRLLPDYSAPKVVLEKKINGRHQ